MSSRMLKVGLSGLYWVNEAVIKAAKTVKDLKAELAHIPESEHEFLEKIHELFHKEEKPSVKKEKGGE